MLVPVTFSSRLLELLHEAHTLELVSGFIILVLLARLMGRIERDRLRIILVLLVLHLLLVPLAALLYHPERHENQTAAYVQTKLAVLICAALAAIGVLTILFFAVLLPRLRLRVPVILRDIIGALASLIAILMLASRAGLNLSSIIATSAVLTAVIGLSLQATLGNVVAGLSVQFDNSVRVGDWVKVGDLVGRVTEIRWRSTSVETRNWETVIIPNSVLTTTQILVLGRRGGQPAQWRRWVWFNVDFRHSPAEIIALVTDALCAAPIERVASQPPPSCVLMDLHDSSCRYAVRYWLTDLANDDPTDSVVRTRIYFALKRAGISPSLPAQTVFLTEDSQERRAVKQREEHERRLHAVATVDFFTLLSAEDREQVAAGLRYAPFTRGEVMTHQGAEAHWLYLIIEGRAVVRVQSGSIEQEVAHLQNGNFFGEMSLMTGEPRSATVVAASDVDCYRLDKHVFQEIIRRDPELAERVADMLAHRKVELIAARENLDAAARARHMEATRRDLASRIRAFFGIDNDRKAAG
jgi:small-conductance mechanosensitive channel/CRP-like cAMP-binding protein